MDLADAGEALPIELDKTEAKLNRGRDGSEHPIKQASRRYSQVLLPPGVYPLGANAARPAYQKKSRASESGAVKQPGYVPTDKMQRMPWAGMGDGADGQNAHSPDEVDYALARPWAEPRTAGFANRKPGLGRSTIPEIIPGQSSALFDDEQLPAQRLAEFTITSR
jgi:hypothetical protein